jgi:membrane protein implicated in regulation of membrane protease activity
MYSESVLLLGSGGIGLMFGGAALAAEVHGVAAVLCGLVFALAALCLLTGWRYWSQSALVRYRARRVEERRADALG